MLLNGTGELQAVEICGKLLSTRLRVERPPANGMALLGGTSGRRERPEPVRACSNCAGDYEDPERTAGDETDEDDRADQDESVDEFPKPPQ